jgi:hypothetical protein
MNAKERKIVDDLKDAYKNGSAKDKQAIIRGAQLAGQKWLTNEEFKKQFEIGKDIASDRGDDDLTMQFWLFGTPHDKESKEKDFVTPVMMMDWEPESDQQKQMYMMGLGAKIADQYPHHMLTTVVQISEAWVVTRDKDAPEEDSHVMPSESPNRVEVVFVHAMSMDQRQSWWQAEIIRDKEGKFKELKELTNDEYDPNKTSEYKAMTNKLSIGIFMGNGAAKRKNMEEEPSGKTDKH